MSRRILVTFVILLTFVFGQFIDQTTPVYGQDVLSVEEIASFKETILNENLSIPDVEGKTISREEAEVSLANIESETLANGPLEDIEIQAYFPTYQLEHATQITISDYTYQYYATYTTEGLADPANGMSYEEAVQMADDNPDQVKGLWQIFQDSITNDNAYGISLTQSQFEWLPEDAAYWTLVHHYQMHGNGGDPSTVLSTLVEIYPEVQNVTDSIDTTVIEEAFIQDYYILRPGEGGNESEENYVFAVEFNDEYPVQDCYDQVVVSQNGESLVRADYSYDTGKKCVYYILSDTESAINLTLGERVIEIYPTTVFNLPPASAAYLSEDSTQAIIFDFGKMYYLTRTADDYLDGFNLVEDSQTISAEASGLMESISVVTGSDDWVVYESNLKYQYHSKTDEVYATAMSETGEVTDLGYFSTETQWQGMMFNEIPFYGAAYWGE